MKEYDEKSAFADLLINEKVKFTDDFGIKTSKHVATMLTEVEKDSAEVQRLTERLHQLNDRRVATSHKASALLDMLFMDQARVHKDAITAQIKAAWLQGAKVPPLLDAEFTLEKAKAIEIERAIEQKKQNDERDLMEKNIAVERAEATDRSVDSPEPGDGAAGDFMGGVIPENEDDAEPADDVSNV